MKVIFLLALVMLIINLIVSSAIERFWIALWHHYETDLSEFKEEGIEHLNVYMISLKIKMLLVFKTGNQKATEASNR